ncbi:MAG TPA: PD-(D/E)XK nuclease family protein, partial [Mariprofundaceae bacterium]|nr:PD-(D/E)XK nuclease family protein [Mariprofundaceae bacterium]
MAYDQDVAPDGVAAGSASIGKLFVGPIGLLNVMETQLGLSGKEIHQAIRIQRYMECMEQFSGLDEGAFFAESFSADPWSSAKQMLSWRDELVLAGWDGNAASDFTPRLKAIAGIEAHLPDQLKEGQGDRLKTVLSELSEIRSLSIENIDVVDRIDALPALLQQLMQALIKSHVSVNEIKPQVVHSEGNLGCVKQAMLSDASRKSVDEGDGSLILLDAEDEWSAANAVAAWLKGDEASNGNVLLIQGQGSDVLDAALQRVGLPVQGSSKRSPWRAALQILPLALANVWQPLNVHALLEFLSLPCSPVQAFVARLLREALQREPGVGGERWQKAEEKIAVIRRATLMKDGVSEDQAEIEAQAFVKDMNRYLTGYRFNPKDGIPPKVLKDICEWVKRGLKSPELERSMAQALAQADRMAELADRHDRPIPRAQVERMLDSVIAEGGQNPDAVAEASAWMQVSDPGAIAGAVGTIIWWDFTDPGQTSVTFWSTQERGALGRIGVHLESPSRIREREARQGRNALRYAGKRLILVYPRRINGEAVPAHPLWDEIRHYAVEKNTKDADSMTQRLVIDGNTLNSSSGFSFAGRSLELQKQPDALLPQPSPSIKVKAGSISKPEKLSYSQMSTLIGCPAKWALQYHVGLETIDSLSLPTGNTMIGILCHKVVEELYKNPESWIAANVRDRASELYKELVPQMAAVLLEPGRELERERYRFRVCDAVETLIRAIDAAGLHVVDTEGWVDGKMLDGIPFGGYIDLLLEDDQGNTYVIDLKWSGSTKYKHEEIEKGEALQLASYAWLLRSENGAWAPGAYFMLAQGELLTADPKFNVHKMIESPLSVDQVWGKGSKTWLQMFNRMKN